MTPETILQMAYDMWKARGGGWLFLLPMAPMVLVQLYKTEMVQGLVAQYFPKFAFAAMSKPKQMLVSFLVGALPVLASYIFTVPVPQALMLSVSAGAAAVFGYPVAKFMARTNVATSAAMNLPSFAVKPMSLVFPLDVKTVLARQEEKKK